MIDMGSLRSTVLAFRQPGGISIRREAHRLNDRGTLRTIREELAYPIAAVFPGDGDTIDMRPESDRASARGSYDILIGITSDAEHGPLRATDAERGTSGDEVTWHGQRYVVVMAQGWSQGGFRWFGADIIEGEPPIIGEAV